MLKEYRVNVVRPNAPEELVLGVTAVGLKSAAKRVIHDSRIRLPAGTYYIFEEGCYQDGL